MYVQLFINRFTFLDLVKKKKILSFLQGNIQRSQLVVEQLGDSRKSMVKVRGNMPLFIILLFITLFLMPIGEESLDKDALSVFIAFERGKTRHPSRNSGLNRRYWTYLKKRIWLVVYLRGKIQNLATTNHRLFESYVIRMECFGSFPDLRVREFWARQKRHCLDTYTADKFGLGLEANCSFFFPQVLDHRQRVMEIIQKQMNKRNPKKKSQ